MILIAKAGSNFEKEKEIGGAHFLEHLVFDGTQNYPSRDKIKGLILDVGGRGGASTSRESVDFDVKILKKDMERGFKYLSELILRPLMREEDVTKQKGIITQEINRFVDDPEAYVGRISYKLLFPGQRMGRFNSGDVSDVSKLSKTEIKSFKDRNYVAKNFVLSVCGNIDAKEVFDLSEKYFGEMDGGERNDAILFNQKPGLDVLVDKRESLKQTQLLVSFYGISYKDERRYALTFLRNILGGSSLSRLFRRIRTEKGYAYSVSAFFSAYSNVGVFGIYAGIDEAKTGEVLKIIKDECRRISTDLVDDAEYERVKKNVEAGFVYSLESPFSRAEFYAYSTLLGKEWWTHETELKSMLSVKKEEILGVSRDLLSQEPKITVLTKALEENGIRNFWV